MNVEHRISWVKWNAENGDAVQNRDAVRCAVQVIDHLGKENAILRAGIKAVQALMDNSDGRHEEWLIDFEAAVSLLAVNGAQREPATGLPVSVTPLAVTSCNTRPTLI